MTTTGTEELISSLKEVLLDLNAHPYPEVACPPSTPRRASVAVILRIQPNYSHWPAIPEHRHTLHSQQSYPHKPRRRSSAASHNTEHGHGQTHEKQQLSFKAILDSFFEQDWVKHGDPELLFIKRATRVGDKWNGHVALPGGKRDPEDADDAVTAMREAMEEVGIDLSFSHAISVGNLPQRVVTTSWGKVPLMVLCPYVYLLTSPEYPAQRLQPTEVASTHWVSLRALMSPALRTHEYADVSARLAKSELGIKKWFLQAMLSKMMFAAIRLLPSESTYCASIPDFIPSNPSPSHSSLGKIKELFSSPEDGYLARQPPPLLLWGLTLGVISDFLEHLPPHNALELWTYPTFSNWDVRFTMWAMSYRFRKRKAEEMSTMSARSTKVPIFDGNVEEGAATVAEGSWATTNPGDGAATRTAGSEAAAVDAILEGEESEEDEPGEVGIAGLGVGRHWGKKRRAKMVARGAAVNSMLEGYYPIVRRAVATALVGRIAAISFAVYYAYKMYKRK